MDPKETSEVPKGRAVSGDLCDVDEQGERLLSILLDDDDDPTWTLSKYPPPPETWIPAHGLNNTEKSSTAKGPIDGNGSGGAKGPDEKRPIYYPNRLTRAQEQEMKKIALDCLNGHSDRWDGINEIKDAIKMFYQFQDVYDQHFAAHVLESENWMYIKRLNFWYLNFVNANKKIMVRCYNLEKDCFEETGFDRFVGEMMGSLH